MRRKKAPWVLLMGVAWLIGPAIFLLMSVSGGSAGFPLDDSWIHQTYARALSQGQGWSYAGEPASAGSTSPAWTLLQVPGHWLGLAPLAWSFLLGIGFLLSNAFFLSRWTKSENPNGIVPVFLFALWEWHLIWASVSGMETVFFCAWISLSLMVISHLLHNPAAYGSQAPFLIGLLLGAGIWIRPEAILFSSLALLVITKANGRLRWKPTIVSLAGTGMALIAYFGFELALHGRMWPNTFFAKPAEYQSLTAGGILSRLTQPWIPLLAGPFSILIVFLLVFVITEIRSRSWKSLWPLAWVAAHMLVFVIHLPVTYQHGRYFIPVLPVLLSYGVLGYLRTAAWAVRNRSIRIVRSVFWISAVALLILFLGIGASQYGQDVQIIQKEMVESSFWIREHTPAAAVIAAHDIGALGYFGERTILDLGGLTDLDALDLLSGRKNLSAFITEQGAEYLVTFPGFYISDLAECVPVWTSTGSISIAWIGGKMSIYHWPSSCNHSAGVK